MRRLVCLLPILLLPASVALAQGGTLELMQGTVKLLREGRSQFLTSLGARVRLQRGDRLHTGRDARALIRVRGETEVIELFSNAFLHFKGVTTRQTKLALLTGKGSFKVAPAAEEPSEQTALKSLRSQPGVPQKFGLKERLDPPKKPGAQQQAGSRGSPEGLPSLHAREQRDPEKDSRFWAQLGPKPSAAQQRIGPRKPLARFQVRTVTAIVAVRGTDFLIATAGDTTNLFTLDGEVGIAAVDLPDHEVTVPANTVSRVQGGFAPTQPEAVDAEERAQILESEGVEGFEEIKFGVSETTAALVEQRRTGAEADAAPLLDEAEADELLDLLEEVEAETPSTPPATLETNIQLQLNFQ